MLVKYITTKSASFAKVSLFFDDNIRLRTKRPGNKSDELCLNMFHIPKSSSGNSTHSTTYKNLSYETCKPMVPLIEPYSDLEINKYSYFELMDFNVGKNLFSAPHDIKQVDVFSAGFSGHTVDIMLLLSTFIFETMNDNNIFIILVSCLIWMLPYYHHSLREIISIALIFLDQNGKTYNEQYSLILALFNKRSTLEEAKAIIDKIFTMLSKNIETQTECNRFLSTFSLEKSLFNDFLSNSNDKIIEKKLRDINTKKKMIKFLDLLNNIDIQNKTAGIDASNERDDTDTPVIVLP